MLMWKSAFYFRTVYIVCPAINELISIQIICFWNWYLLLSNVFPSLLFYCFTASPMRFLRRVGKLRAACCFSLNIVAVKDYGIPLSPFFSTQFAPFLNDSGS